MEHKIEKCSSSQDLLYSLDFDLTPYFANSQEKASELLNDIKNGMNRQIQELKSEYLAQYSRCGVFGNVTQIQDQSRGVFSQQLITDCEHIFQSSVDSISSYIKSDTSGFFNKVKSLFSNPFAKHKEIAMTQISMSVDNITEKVVLYASNEIKERVLRMERRSNEAIKSMIDIDRQKVERYLDSTSNEINENTKNRNATQEYIEGLMNYRNSMKEVV